MVAILTGNWDVYLISLHAVHTREYGHTSRFAHLLGPLSGRRAFSGSCWFQTPVRNSDHHGNIMVNIMIAPLPSSIRVRTIVKE